MVMTRSSRSAWVALVVALTLLAAIPRLSGLATLSFYADEETTALPARSLAEGNGARMPSGMEYRRALPYTLLAAASARMMGTERDLPYRLPAAVLGILTIPALLVVGRRLVGVPVAVTAATLLTFSEWHLVFSRQARMYGPLLLFYILAAGALWRWSEEGGAWRGTLAALLVALTVMVHPLGMSVVLFALLPLCFPRKSRVGPVRAIAFAVGTIALGTAYHRFFESVPFNTAGVRVEAPILTSAPSTPLSAALDAVPLGSWGFAVVAVGAALGVWIAILVRGSDRESGYGLRMLARLTLASCTGAMIGAGQLYGAALSGGTYLILFPPGIRALIARARLPLALLGALAVMVAALILLRFGMGDGIRALMTLPFPYAALLAGQMPVIMPLFAIMCAVLALREPRGDEAGLRGIVACALLTFAAMGVVSEWGGTRYLFSVYPLVLIGASAAIVLAAQSVAARMRAPAWSVTAFAAALAASGLLLSHGIPQAITITRLEHGEAINELVHMYPMRPDHQEPGEFVRKERRADDVVIAEDPLQQTWYAGAVDYWLRAYGDAHGFLRARDDGRLTDIYVRSELLTGRRMIDSLVAHAPGRIWVITSAETRSNRAYYLDADQRRWLDSIERTLMPVFTGRDAVTAVYCLGCAPVKPARNGEPAPGSALPAQSAAGSP